jgi:hypothetical protein
VESKDAKRGSRKAVGSSSAGVTPLRKRRLSYGVFPKPRKGDVPYANSRPELADLCIGEKVRLMMSTPAWNEILRPSPRGDG